MLTSNYMFKVSLLLLEIINLLLPIFPPSSHLIVVFFFPVGLSSSTRPVENAVLTTKGLQERKNTTIEWEDCANIYNKNK